MTTSKGSEKSPSTVTVSGRLLPSVSALSVVMVTVTQSSLLMWTVVRTFPLTVMVLVVNSDGTSNSTLNLSIGSATMSLIRGKETETFCSNAAKSTQMGSVEVKSLPSENTIKQ